MEWRVIPSFPDYEVSEEGRVRLLVSHTNGRRVWPAGHLAKPRTFSSGYSYVELMDAAGRSRTAAVHRVVCEAFHGTSSVAKPCVAHWNGDRSDNHPANLRWASYQENAADRDRHGQTARGERGRAKLTTQQVALIRQRKTSGEHARSIATEFGVSRSTVNLIAKGLRWPLTA